MSAAEILNKYLGSQQLGTQTATKVILAMIEYGADQHAIGKTDGQEVIETFRRLVFARDAKIRELEQKLEEVRRAVK